MEATEVPTENTQEEIHHHAEHSQDKWVMRVALSSAIFVTFAAIASLLAAHNADEAMLEQIRASDQWSFYQAKSIKNTVIKTKTDLFSAMGKTPAEADLKKIEEYNGELEEIKKQAEEKEHTSRHHLAIHGFLSRAVTMFQVAIAVSAIAVLSRRKQFWYVSILVSLWGLVLFIQGLVARA